MYKGLDIEFSRYKRSVLIIISKGVLNKFVVDVSYQISSAG